MKTFNRLFLKIVINYSKRSLLLFLIIILNVSFLSCISSSKAAGIMAEVSTSPADTLVPQTTNICNIEQIVNRVDGIKLINSNTDLNSQNNLGFYYFIDENAQMPIMTFSTIFTSVNNTDASDSNCLKNTLANNFDWNINIEYWDGNAIGQNKITIDKLGAQRKGKQTGDFWEYFKTQTSSTLTLDNNSLYGKYGGGIGTVNVKFHYKDINLSNSLPIVIEAYEPSHLVLQKGFGELKYQVLGYLESRFQHISYNTPLLNCANSDCTQSDGGFGITQITDCIGANGTLNTIASKKDQAPHGFPTYEQIWNWKANIEVGKSCFDTKIKKYCSDLTLDSIEQLKCGYASYNGSSSYGTKGATILSEIQKGKYRKGWFLVI